MRNWKSCQCPIKNITTLGTLARISIYCPTYGGFQFNHTVFRFSIGEFQFTVPPNFQFTVPEISIYRPTVRISIYCPTRFQFTVPLWEFQFTVPRDFNLPSHCREFQFTVPQDSIYRPTAENFNLLSHEIQFTVPQQRISIYRSTLENFNLLSHEILIYRPTAEDWNRGTVNWNFQWWPNWNSRNLWDGKLKFVEIVRR